MVAPALPLDGFRQAAARVADRVHRTPVFPSAHLSDRIGAPVWLKAENLQKTGSFKVRGALHKVLSLDEAARRRGVVTISAGNHAQALAWAARAAGGVPCTVVMPAHASPTKAAASRGYGAEVILHGTTHEAFTKSFEIAEERGMTFTHPFDDLDVVAGHGGVGVEILDDVTDPDVVVVPIGGGGLISGIAGVIKQARPGARIYGVEPEGACAMRRSLDAGHPVTLDEIATVADGLAPPMAGRVNFEFVRDLVEDVVTVTDEEIVDAMGVILTRTKLVVEPSGAAATAALLQGKIPVAGAASVVSVLSGGNVGLEQLGRLFAGDGT